MVSGLMNIKQNTKEISKKIANMEMEKNNINQVKNSQDNFGRGLEKKGSSSISQEAEYK